MASYTTNEGTVWTIIKGTTLIIGRNTKAGGGIAIADVVTNEKILLIPEEIEPLIAVLQPSIPVKSE